MKKAEFQEVRVGAWYPIHEKCSKGMMFTCEPVSILNLMGVFFDQCLLWQKLDCNEKKMYLPYQHKNPYPNPTPQTEIGHTNFDLHTRWKWLSLLHFLQICPLAGHTSFDLWASYPQFVPLTSCSRLV